MNRDMTIQLDRLLLMAEERARDSVGDATYAEARCGACHDTGRVENWYGWFTTPRGLKVQASQERPVYTRCHDCNPKQEHATPKRRGFGA